MIDSDVLAEDLEAEVSDWVLSLSLWLFVKKLYSACAESVRFWSPSVLYVKTRGHFVAAKLFSPRFWSVRGERPKYRG